MVLSIGKFLRSSLYFIGLSVRNLNELSEPSLGYLSRNVWGNWLEYLWSYKNINEVIRALIALSGLLICTSTLIGLSEHLMKLFVAKLVVLLDHFMELSLILLYYR